MADDRPMAKRRITFSRWLEELGDAVPLRMVPALLGLPNETVRRRIEGGLIPVHTFRALNGETRRYVRVADLKRQVAKPELKIENLRRAFQQIMTQDSGSSG